MGEAAPVRSLRECPMSLPVVVAILGLWGALMYRYGRSVLFPPALLSFVWTITLFAIWLCGDIYFPLTNTANLIVLTGVLAFSFGGICAIAAPLWKGRRLEDVSANRRRQVDGWLDVAGVLAVLNIPISYFFFKMLSESVAPRESMWRQI